MSSVPIRLGVIVPSSNTSLEPLTYAIISSISTPLRPVSVHFSRLSVTTLNLSGGSSAQFDHGAFLAAAQLLADAKVDAIGWSGTAAGWLGFANDEELCHLLSQHHGIPVTTSTLALNQALHLANVKKLGLVTPYTEDMNRVIMRNYADLGFPIARECERHLGITDNHIIAQVDADTLTGLVRGVVEAGADAVTTFCTNLNSAHLVQEWEKELGVPVFDSVATVIWDLCRLTDVDMSGARQWGRMFC